MRSTKNLLQSFKSRGVYGTLRWIFYGYFTVNKFIVFYRNLKRPLDYHHKDHSVRLCRISISDLTSLRNQEEKLPVEFYCDLTHHFSTAYVAIVDGKLAAIQWLVYPGEMSRFLNLKNGDVELNYNTVLPEFRGRRLAKVLMAFVIKSCTEELNFKRMFEVVNVNNIPQYKLMLRLGFEPVEVLTHFGFNRPKATLEYVK